MKRVFIVHGWGGHPGENWFPWLKHELENRGFEVHIPQLPDADYPRIAHWVSTLTQAVGTLDNHTYFVGHSLGCQTILRYLENMDGKAGGAVFIAGFVLPLKGLDAEETETFKSWASTPLDLAKVRQHLGKSVAIFSDNDQWVQVENAAEYEKHLGSKIIIEHEKGHYNEKAGFLELPLALQELLKVIA